jgi:hypothetical protein
MDLKKHTNTTIQTNSDNSVGPSERFADRLAGAVAICFIYDEFNEDS